MRTKLSIPPLRPNLVPRQHLLEQLDEGLKSGRKLTLISAPAGFGKSTLASEWVTGSEYVSAWLSLDAGDNDLTRFLAYVVAALRHHRADSSAVFGKGVLAMLESSRPPPLEVTLTTLVNELAGIGDRTLLVLDDYHMIGSSAVDHALTFLLENMPPQLHVAIVTREDPQLPLARLRARGHLTELRALDLRFSSAEAAEFLNESMGLALSGEDTDALEERTEGWIAGLQMAAISLQGREDVSELVRSFTGSHRYVLDYLIEEVLLQQPDELQDFLLQTAVLERLSGSLCDALTGQANGQATLEHLEHTNLFIIPLDEERRWYRYHHLFADLLRTRLRQIKPNQMIALYGNASRWFEASGFVTEAIDYSLLAEEFERAARLLEESVETLRRQAELRNLRLWLERLPEDVLLARPELAIYWARYQCTSGHLNEAQETLKRAEQLFETSTRLNESGELSKTAALLDADRMKLRGRTAATRALIASFQGDVPGIMDFGHQALNYLSDDDLTWRGAVALVLGNAYGFQGDMEAAYKARSEALKACKAADDSYYIIVANLELAITLREQGQLARTVETCQQQWRHVVELGFEQTRLAGWLLAIWGETIAELNDLDRAKDHVRRGFAITEQSADLQMVGWSFMCLMRTLISSGNLAEAEEAIQTMESLARETQIPPWVADQLTAWQARLWLAQGKLFAASAWATNHGFMVNGEPQPLKDTDFFSLLDWIVLARMLIDQDRLAEAQSVLKQLLQAAEAGGRVSRSIEITILLALVSHLSGATEAAYSYLEQALALAEPRSFVRVFLDEGQRMARLLQQAVASGHGGAHGRRLLGELRPAHSPSAVLGDDSTELVEPLSERELEVLGLIAAGLTNKDIASRLYLALNTVKAHTRNIYEKLAVHNRIQAVARARALGLLPPP